MGLMGLNGLKEEPVLEHLPSVGSEDALGMELNAANVHGFMA